MIDRAFALLKQERIPIMTKADLVDKVTALGDLTRRDGEVIVDTLFESVIGALKANDKVEGRGFGSFRTRQRNPRTAQDQARCRGRSRRSPPPAGHVDNGSVSVAVNFFYMPAAIAAHNLTR